MNLTERWKAHTISQKTDLRARLIDAVAAHEGWEESAIALVDEAIIPVIKKGCTHEWDNISVCDEYEDYIYKHCLNIERRYNSPEQS
jgi:hypothetical protein